MKIVIPSYGRAGFVSTYEKIPGSIIVVPESQKEDYLKYHDEDRLLTIPDELDGTAPKKRNAVLNLIDDEEIFMIDDDLVSIYEIKTGKEIDGESFVEIIKNGFSIIKELDLHYFGFNWDNQPLHHKENVPFSFNKRFYFGFGIRKSDLRFDENITRLDDCDFWLQQTRKFKATFRFNHIFIKCIVKGKRQKGGIAEKSDGIADETYLLKKWGSEALRYSKKGELLATSPYKGV